MNKEILEWLNEKNKNYRATIERFERAGWSDKGLVIPNFKKELKIVQLIKKELKEKDKLEQKQILNSRTEEPMEVPVLDDVEKRYLKNVLRPFKDKCEYVEKLQSCYKEGWAYILIVLNDTYFELPRFETNTMYKNMMLEKRYTLDELGIKY